MTKKPMEGFAAAKSHGIVMGRAQSVCKKKSPIPECHIAPGSIKSEQARLHQAVTAALHELDIEYEYLLNLKQQDATLILDTHRMLLLDPELIVYPKSLIQHEQINAEWALKRHITNIIETFDAMHDTYLRSRHVDIEQVGERLMRQLQGSVFHSGPCCDDMEGIIVVAHELSPSEIVKMWRHGVAGVICEQGGFNSHAMIIARSIGLPALMGIEASLANVVDGEMVILDAERGYWKFAPSCDEQQKYQHFMDAISTIHDDLMCFSSRSSLSSDGTPLPIQANLEFQEELELAQHVGAEGIGLFRTEFIFAQHTQEPTEDEQFKLYQHTLQHMQRVTFRLLDVGGDKPLLFQHLSGSEYQANNPALGLRGARLLLHSPRILKTQLNALLRASAFGDMRILVPMVSQVDDMIHIRSIMQTCCTTLNLPPVPLGCMIEIPAAVMIADELAKVSDFFAIGTNDLTQYTFAADRADDSVASYYEESHPIIMQMIQQTVQAAKKANIQVSVCGELAANPNCTQTFLNMGMSSLSMSLHSILPIRRVLSKLQYLPENS